jgi:hypothetical protein
VDVGGDGRQNPGLRGELDVLKRIRRSLWRRHGGPFRSLREGTMSRNRHGRAGLPIIQQCGLHRVMERWVWRKYPPARADRRRPVVLSPFMVRRARVIARTPPLSAKWLKALEKIFAKNPPLFWFGAKRFGRKAGSIDQVGLSSFGPGKAHSFRLRHIRRRNFHGAAHQLSLR